ncbi:MAG TPA: hypothetical protein VLD67_03505, partial [Vicinamibacterales bacterium]|nr:hypothetical protein [Vicinamibacterales bacterium]
MNAPVRFACANARMHALKRDLWDGGQLALRLAGGPAAVPEEDLSAVYSPLVRWYEVLQDEYIPARSVLGALLRVHEIENLKLLWRCAVRQRPLPQRCWRPLGRLAAISEEAAAESVPLLVERLRHTPYAHLTAATWRSHGVDLLAAELALDGWVLSAVYEAAIALSPSERLARDLLFDWLRERDVDLLGRAARAYEFDPSFAASLTTVLRRECRHTTLVAVAAWKGGAMTPHLPQTIRRAGSGATDWDALLAALRRARARRCRRALVAYPYQI